MPQEQIPSANPDTVTSQPSADIGVLPTVHVPHHGADQETNVYGIQDGLPMSPYGLEIHERNAEPVDAEAAYARRGNESHGRYARVRAIGYHALGARHMKAVTGPTGTEGAIDHQVDNSNVSHIRPRPGGYHVPDGVA